MDAKSLTLLDVAICVFFLIAFSVVIAHIVKFIKVIKPEKKLTENEIAQNILILAKAYKELDNCNEPKANSYYDSSKIDIVMSKDKILKLIYYWVDQLIDFDDDC